MDWQKLIVILSITVPGISGCAAKGSNPFSGFFAARELADSDAYTRPDTASDGAASGGQGRMATKMGGGTQSASNPERTLPASEAQSVRLASSQNGMSNARTATYTAQPSLVVLGDEKQFSNLMQGAQGPVVLDFFTTWCGPCKKQSQILHQMESVAHEKGATIIKVDAEKFPKIAKQFGVKAYPTLVAVKDGGIAQRQTGVADAKTLERWFSL